MGQELEQEPCSLMIHDMEKGIDKIFCKSLLNDVSNATQINSLPWVIFDYLGLKFIICIQHLWVPRIVLWVSSCRLKVQVGGPNYLLRQRENLKFHNLLIDRFLSWQTKAKGHHVPEKALAVKSRSESGLQPRCQSPVWRGICWLVWQLTAHGLTSGHQAPASDWPVWPHPGLWLVTPRVPGLDASMSRSLSMLQSWAAVTRPH